jgi:peptidoglycan/xylan/chitin deacetylase (PgdA/CDA1 family)
LSLFPRLKRVLLSTGHYGRRLRGLAFPGVGVLCYHGVREDGLKPGSLPFEDLHVPAAELAAHARLVRETCHPISLEQWRAALAGGPPLPERPVLFTFDDGYRSHLRAVEILERHQIPSVLFACCDPIERQVAFWFDAVARDRGTAGEAGEIEVERLKEVPYKDWRAATARAERRLDDGAPEAVLRLAELRELALRPGVEIGGHTVHHPILARAGRADQLAEIEGNRRRLQEWLGLPIKAFAYPNGRPGLDYTAETAELVRQVGYDFAFTTRNGFAGPDEPPLERSRFLMVAGITGEELAHRLCYSWQQPLASAS